MKLLTYGALKCSVTQYRFLRFLGGICDYSDKYKSHGRIACSLLKPKPVVLYNSVTGKPFRTTQERKAYYLAKPAPKTIHAETGVVQNVTGVTHMFSEYPPAVEELQSRPTEIVLKTEGIPQETTQRKRGKSK